MESWDVRSGGGVGDHLVTGCQQVLWMYLVPCLSLCIRYSRSSLHPAGAPGHGRASPRALAGPMHVCVLLPRYRDGGVSGRHSPPPTHTTPPSPKTLLEPEHSGVCACPEAHGTPLVCRSWAEIERGEKLSQAFYQCAPCGLSPQVMV